MTDMHDKIHILWVDHVACRRNFGAIYKRDKPHDGSCRRNQTHARYPNFHWQTSYFVITGVQLDLTVQSGQDKRNHSLCARAACGVLMFSSVFLWNDYH